MTMALELLVFTGIFALAVGLLGTFVGSSQKKNLELRAAHASRRYARQPWDEDRSDGRRNK